MEEGRGKERGACGSQGTRDILCPFFRSHNGYEINCEGYTDTMVSAMKYRTQTDKKFWQSVYCKQNYQYCEHYNALMMLKYHE